jgi:hypothetical protein
MNKLTQNQIKHLTTFSPVLLWQNIAFVSLREAERVENPGFTNWHQTAEECQFVVSVTNYPKMGEGNVTGP